MFVNEIKSARVSDLPESQTVAPEKVISAELETIWQKICAGLRRDMGAQIFGQWIKPIKLSVFDSDTGRKLGSGSLFRAFVDGVESASSGGLRSCY